ncbi:MAG: FHA domain-containing protein [Xenococcaceae cyanobacterium]
MAAKPAKPHRDHLLIIQDDKGIKEVVLKNQTYSLGRQEQCDIRVHSQFVSRRHATLLRCSRRDGTAYYRIIDGDSQGKVSANGLVINGRKVSSHDLKNGDKLVFGSQVFATYEFRQRDIFPTIPPDDPFDITLIDPAMMDNDEESSATDEVTTSLES